MEVFQPLKGGAIPIKHYKRRFDADPEHELDLYFRGADSFEKRTAGHLIRLQDLY